MEAICFLSSTYVSKNWGKMQKRSSFAILFYLRWTQVPQLFAVFFPTATFWRPKWPSRLFAVLFWLPTKVEGKKGRATFCRPFGDFLVSKTQKRTAKGHATFFVLQKDAKKTPKGRRANFVLQLVGNLFWTPKGRLCKKDGKKSCHLHSAQL